MRVIKAEKGKELGSFTMGFCLAGEFSAHEKGGGNVAEKERGMESLCLKDTWLWYLAL